MTAELDNARRRVEAGDHARALDVLQAARAQLRHEPASARELVEVTTLLRTATDSPRIQRFCDAIIADARAVISAEPSSLVVGEPGDEALDPGSGHIEVYMSTTFDIPGHEIVAFHGPVFGLVVRSRNVFANFGASAKSLVGGELRGLTRLMSEGRDDAVRRLGAAARAKGANAVIGLRFDSSELGDTGNEVVAYGTAVTVRPTDRVHGEPAPQA